MHLDTIGVIGAATAIVGFLSIWIKMGVEKGEQKKAMELLEQKSDKHEKEIAELKNETHGIQLKIAEFMGKIEAKLDYIKETVTDLKPKGGRRAAEKQD